MSSKCGVKIRTARAVRVSFVFSRGEKCATILLGKVQFRVLSPLRTRFSPPPLFYKKGKKGDGDAYSRRRKRERERVKKVKEVVRGWGYSVKNTQNDTRRRSATKRCGTVPQKH